MKTILVGDCASDRLYQMLDPDASNEQQFEYSVAKVLSCVYSQYSCVVFGGDFLYDDRTYRPDLALVARDFSHWFIIEVELASHSFEGHVLPQVRAFRYGEPQQNCATILARELRIPRESASTLISLIPRSVAVVVNKHDAKWETSLAAHNIQMLTVSIFRAPKGEAVEVAGSLEVLAENLGFGTYSATDRSLRFAKNLRVPTGTIQINDPTGVPSLWTVTLTLDSTWITKDVGTPNIEQGAFVQLIRTVDGRLSLRRPA